MYAVTGWRGSTAQQPQSAMVLESVYVACASVSHTTVAVTVSAMTKSAPSTMTWSVAVSLINFMVNSFIENVITGIDRATLNSPM